MEDHLEQHPQSGQVLVLIALSLLVLVAFVALAVDGGSLYQERRAMQNAADAGALAGAQEICFGNPDDAEAKAREYAIDRNGAEGAEVTVSGHLSVTVVASETVKTYFAGVIGFREVPVQADATAVCGKAAAGGGVWPIAFDSSRWPDDANLRCGEKLIFWEDSNVSEGRTDCTEYDCCKLFDRHGNLLDNLCQDGKTQPDILPLDGRAWLDFSAGISGSDPCDSKGCGSNEATDRIDGHTNQGDVCENFVIIGDCYPNPDRVAANALQAVDRAAERIVNIPLYDACSSGKIGDPVLGNDHTVYPVDFCPDSAQVCTIGHNPGNDCGSNRFRINKMACVQIGSNTVDGWQSYAYLMEAYDPTKPNLKLSAIKVLVATIPCNADGTPHDACASASGWTWGSIPEPGDVRAVNLVD